jgi:dUTPase
MNNRLPKLFVKKLVKEALLPKKGSSKAAGYDLHSV